MSTLHFMLMHFGKCDDVLHNCPDDNLISDYQTIIETSVNSAPGQNGRHFAGKILKCIFMNENISISNKIWLKIVLKDPIDNNTALVQMMAWRRIGDKPLSEPMLIRFTEAYMRH